MSKSKRKYSKQNGEGNKPEINDRARLRSDGESRHDVFISYSVKDKDFVQILSNELKKNGRRAWVDLDDVQPSEEWLKAIHSGIESADSFIFVISPDSIASQYCNDELSHAYKHNKRQIPILRREVGKQQLPHALASYKWIDFQEKRRFRSALNSLINTLDVDLNHVREHTRILTRAIEWETKRKNRSFLLRGSDLQEAETWLAQNGANKDPKPTQL
ncbi:MAG TPA: toll/interleukin-1 receptor domain-containing protein [Pyrinomonadaceae bacterium]|jgi:hypothetical protein